jgi:Protein of unknown function (DUF3375)
MAAQSRLLDFDTVESLRANHPAWRMLRADNASFAVSFLYRTFVEPNVRTLSQPDLIGRMDDHLFELRAKLGPDVFPRRATEYLDTWAADDAGWLRKYYPAQSDEPHFDMTPAAEKAIEFLLNLRQPSFVATESRLLTVFELLRQIAEGTEADRAIRIVELERRKREIEGQIRRINAGEIDLMDDTQIKDRFLQMAQTARALLSDFRQVEQNFRELDRGVREQIALWEGPKAQLLEKIFGDRDAISASDQGRSFHAFWDFLMSPSKQEELSSLLERALGLPAVRSLDPDPRLARVHHDWLFAGDIAQRTVARLSEQLRRFLDEQTFIENRRIVQIIRHIEQHALSMRDHAPEGWFAEIEANAPELGLPMDRPLYSPQFKASLDSDSVTLGESDVATDALYEQAYLDRERLNENLRRVLQTRSQISLAELVELYPIAQGLAELVAYLGIASERDDTVIDDDSRQRIAWTDKQGVDRAALMPLVIFQRKPV